ncbi:MAG TPA: type IX secretion system membrane protein PorP/SprF [bacterium]|nr:type IX secretion system membrane protein PorP/SprF [bacterium]
MRKLSGISGCVLFTGLLFAAAGSAQAQWPDQAGSSDETHRLGLFVNPALVLSSGPQVISGMKVYHLGFLDQEFGLRNQFLAGSMTWTDWGGALTLSHLSTPMHTMTRGGLSLAWRSSRVTAGVFAGFVSRSFREANLDLVDPEDPLLQNGFSRTGLSIGAGLLCRPGALWRLGASVGDVNRPNLSFSPKPLRERRLVNVEISYSPSVYRLALGWTWEEGRGYPRVGASADVLSAGTVSLGVDYGGFHADWEMSLSRQTRFRYTWQIPISSMAAQSYGSHQIMLSFDLKEPVRSLPCRIQADTDSVWISQKKIVFGEGVPGADSIRACLALEPKEAQEPVEDPSPPDRRLYTRRYNDWIDSTRNKNESGTLLALDSSGVRRASAIRKFLENSEKQIQVRILCNDGYSKETADSGSVVFEKIVPAENIWRFQDRPQRVRIWEVLIQNQTETVYKASGRGRIPDRWVWNWRDGNGSLLEAGWYTLRLRWKEMDNRWAESSLFFFQVVRHRQKIHYAIKKDSQPFSKEWYLYLLPIH